LRLKGILRRSPGNFGLSVMALFGQISWQQILCGTLMEGTMGRIARVPETPDPVDFPTLLK